MPVFKHEVKQLLIYAFALVAFLVLLGQKVDALKSEINSVVRVQCLSGVSTATIAKYNDALSAQIEQQVAAEKINKRRGDMARVALNAALAARLESDLIVLPKPDCSKPLLK